MQGALPLCVMIKNDLVVALCPGSSSNEPWREKKEPSRVTMQGKSVPDRRTSKWNEGKDKHLFQFQLYACDLKHAACFFIKDLPLQRSEYLTHRDWKELNKNSTELLFIKR